MTSKKPNRSTPPRVVNPHPEASAANRYANFAGFQGQPVMVPRGDAEVPGVIKGIRLADDGSPELSVVIDSGIIITAGLGEVRLPNARQLIEQAHRVKQVAERPVASASRSPAHRKPQTNRGTGPASREPGDILVVDHQGSLQAVVPAKAAQVAAREAAAWRAAEGIPDVTRD